MPITEAYEVAAPLPTDYWQVEVSGVSRFLVGLTFYDASHVEVVGGDATLEGSWTDTNIDPGDPNSRVSTRHLADPYVAVVIGGQSVRYDTNGQAAVDFRVTAITPPGGAVYYRLTANWG